MIAAMLAKALETICLTRNALALVVALILMPLGLRGQETSELPASLEHETFDLVNDYRVQQDLPKLKWDPAIANIAREHSQAMATGEVPFGHHGFQDRMSMLHGMLTGMHGGGENVFYTDARPGACRAAVQAWLHSAPHLHNIRGNFQISGLGLWMRSDGAYFFTQIFANVKPLADTP